MKNRFLYIVALLFAFLPACAQEVDDGNAISSDSVRQVVVSNIVPVNDVVGREKSPYTFRPTRLILPAAMIGVGAWAVDNGFLKKEKGKLQNQFQDWSGGKTVKIDDYLQYLPTAASLVMPYLGTNPRLGELDRWIVRVNGYGLMIGLTWGTKKLVNEWRPDGSDEDSFFSGHCAKSFLAAEMIRIDYGPWYGLAAYSVACGVGVLRMYNNKHWANDVIAGAGIGILSARVAYWLLPIEKRILGLDKKKDTSVVAVPYYSPQGGGKLGATVGISF